MKWNFPLALLSAALLVLAFPRVNAAWLAPLALAPLLLAVGREPRPRRRFLLGYAAGVAYWFGVCYWIQFVLSYHGGVGDALGWVLFLLFCLAKAAHFGVFAWLAGYTLRGWWAVPGTAALWVAVEVTHGYLGFAWLALGNAGIEMALPMRLAPYTGVWGLSFVFAMLGAALALALLRRPRLHLAWLLLLPFLIFLPRLPDARRARETAVLVQPNISETAEWTPVAVERMQRALVALSMRAVSSEGEGARRPSLIVWPEVPAPLYYDTDPRFRDYANGLARTAGAALLAGVVAYAPDGAPLNSAQLVSPAGEPVSRYDKVNLVPFGEFVPWPFGYLATKISTEVGDFRAGTRVVISPVDGHRIAAFICYESVFPDFVRRFAASGAEVLFNLSNDGWFGKSAAREQHLRIVRMRAAENRRWILRATNNGITATIDSAGRLRGTLPSYAEAASLTGFTYIPAQTFYTRHGEWFPILCAAGAAAILLRVALAGRRRHG